MKFIRKLSSIVFGLIIVLAIGAYFGIRHFDLNQYKSQVEEIATREIGRQLKINGEASIGISLVPTIVVNDVTLANAPWAQPEQMVAVKQVEVKFALLPLLKKQIVIDKVLLIGAQIYLEQDAKGEANWDLAPKTVAMPKVKAEPSSEMVEKVKKNPELALLAGFAAKSVVIENSFVQYRDGKDTQKLTINEIETAIPSADEQISLAFDVVYNQDKISGEALLGSINTLMKAGEAYPVILNASAFAVDVALQGSIVNIMKAPIYAFEANIYNPAGNFDAPETTLKARIDGTTEELKASIGTLNIANNLISGSAEAKWSGKLPVIKANLNSNKIDLQSLNPKSSPLAFEVPSLISEAQAIALPNEKFPYEVFKQVNADVVLNVKKLIIDKGMEADNVYADAKLNNGVLQISPLKLNFGGGLITIKANVNANQQDIRFDVTSQNMKLQNLHSEFVVSGPKDFGVLSGGNIDIYINGTTGGGTYPQLLQNLKGQMIGIVDKSVLQSGSLEFMKANVITQLLNILKIDTKKSANLDVTCAVVRANIADGKAEFPRGLAFDAKQMTVVSDGRINLLNDKINFTIEPSMNKLVSGNVTQALASFVKVSGTLENPTVGIDDKQAIRTLVGVAATGGVSYLGSQVIMNGDGSPCYTALAGTPYAARFPKPNAVKATAQDVVRDTEKQVKQDLKELKNTAKDFLKALKAQ